MVTFDPRDYAITLKSIYDDVEKEYGELLMQQGITLGESACGSVP